jgi:hypothetical protein
MGGRILPGTLPKREIGADMGKYSELHIQLEQKVDTFLKDQSEENSSLLIAEFTKLILEDADILIDGIPDDEEPGKYDPSGFEGPDHRFYFHMFTSKLRFDDSDAKNPMVTKLKAVLDQVFVNEQLGGFSVNYKNGEGTVLITKEDIYHGLQAAIEASQKH